MTGARPATGGQSASPQIASSFSFASISIHGAAAYEDGVTAPQRGDHGRAVHEGCEQW